MNKFLLMLLALIVATPSSAESKLFEKIKEGLYGEFGSQVAGLPGLKELQELEESKKFKLVTNAPQKGHLTYKADESHKSVWLSLDGSAKAVRVVGDSTLPVGRYSVFVMPKNSQLKYHQEIIDIQDGQTKTLSVEKFYPRNTLFGLNITTTPKNARVRVMNIKPKYRYGMKLPHRNDGYDIEVSKKGYRTIKETITLNSDNQHFHYTLKR